MGNEPGQNQELTLNRSTVPPRIIKSAVQSRVTTRINSDTPRSARKSTIDNSKPPSFSKVVRRVQKTSQDQLLEEAAEKERKQQAAQEAYQVWLSKNERPNQEVILQRTNQNE